MVPNQKKTPLYPSHTLKTTRETEVSFFLPSFPDEAEAEAERLGPDFGFGGRRNTASC
ncbi:hypothetical protein BDW02DRAFT_565341 [Decorospora gaudefroyi]|uniref:Uncharacterized protein n=1 Tax=Decorospora gaudefroyi TaxID=184978 RepID=A0A6A5KQ21_9PLEO|nr:hypothetical protein BDW02DRAFT_565341 [Decorospora gaudefroyi]